MARTHLLKNIIAAMSAALAMAGSAIAAPVASYGDIVAPPGVYFGSGNSNGNWTVSTDNNVEVALRAKNRATLATIDGSSGTYFSASGLCNPTCSGGSKAMWNYEFSVNTQAGGGTLDLTKVRVTLGVDTDSSANASYTVLDVLTNWGDNSYWNGAKRVGASPVAGEFGAQQSANPLFGDSGFNFLPGAGLYNLQLSVYDLATGDMLSQVTTQVQVPEPSGIALAGLALLGLAVVGKRRRS